MFCQYLFQFILILTLQPLVLNKRKMKNKLPTKFELTLILSRNFSFFLTTVLLHQLYELYCQQKIKSKHLSKLSHPSLIARYHSWCYCLSWTLLLLNPAQAFALKRTLTTTAKHGKQQTIYWGEYSGGPSVRGTSYWQASPRATSPSFQSRLQKWHGHRQMWRRRQRPHTLETRFTPMAETRKEETEACHRGEGCSNERKQHTATTGG